MNNVTKLEAVTGLPTIEMTSNLLTGHALDWAVALVTGHEPRIVNGRVQVNECGRFEPFAPTESWEQCGELMDAYITAFHKRDDIGYDEYWASAEAQDLRTVAGFGTSKRLAICRAVVIAKHGYKISVPAVLLEGLV